MNVHSEHQRDPGVELRESVTQGETVAEEKIRREPISQRPKFLPFNRNLALLAIYI